MKEQFKKNKYLVHSVSLFLAILIMTAFEVEDVYSFLVKLGETLLYALSAAFGIYILSIFSTWLIFPLLPKYEDFSNDDERRNYFSLGNSDLLLFIFMTIATTVVLGGLVR